MYKNDIYHLQTIGRYYQRSRDKAHPGQERVLHRVVWTDHFGPIPKGMEIHHKDGNWKNNSIHNLELDRRRSHASYHLRKRWENPAFRARAINRIPNFVAKSLIWHRSLEGREWHRQNGILNWKKRKPTKRTCLVCGREFSAFYKRAALCSKKCSNKHYSGKYDDVPTVCAACGKPFMANRYSKASHCSKSCTTAAMWKARKGVQPDLAGT
jgi:HNH endonuclease